MTKRYFKIETPAYFDTRLNAEVSANTLHIVGEDHRDDFTRRSTNSGCPSHTVTELTAAEYRAVAMAKLRGVVSL